MTEYKKTLAFYHSADQDGHCSGAIIKKAHPEAELIGINYGDVFPWEKIGKDTRVIMADFSLQPWTDMVRLFTQAGSVVWIDHHRTAIEEWLKFKGEHDTIGNCDRAILVDGTAACRLCWRTFFPNLEEPLAVKLIGLYDVWKQDEDERALPFQYGMRRENTWPDNQEFWDNILASLTVGLNQIIRNGQIILDYQEQINKRLQAHAHEVYFEGETFIAMNAGGINSLAFGDTYDPAAHYGCMSYYRKGDNAWTCSLYSPDNAHDLSVIAKNLGGGGHASACGFQVDDETMRAILA